MRRLLLPISACCLVFLTTACAPPARERFFWPPPPEQPQVEYIGVYRSSNEMTSGAAKALMSVTGGTEQLPLNQPTAIVADDHGKVFVSDSEFNKILLFDFVKKSYGDYITEGLKKPFGLDIDSKGNLYVVERKGAVVKVFSPERALLRSFGAGQLKEPIRVAVDDERGRIYVSDLMDHQVKVFSLDGQFIRFLGDENGFRSEADGEFNRPNGVTVDAAGNLYVCDQLNARIQVFDPTGAFIRKFGIRGDTLNTFEAPTGLTFDNAGRLWITDLRKGALLTYSVGTDPQYLFATYGPTDTFGRYNLRSPMDISIDKNSRIYVADSLGDRISVWQILDAPYLSEHPLPADWLQRTDIIDRWYRESGETPPPKEGAAVAPAPAVKKTP